jgi:hypothetical protein
MNINFNKKKYLQLKAQSDKLRQEGKFLENYDKAKYKELSQYLIWLESYSFWKNRYKYLQLLENAHNIDVKELIDKFFTLRSSDLTASRMLQENLETEIDFQLNPECRGFTELINYIFSVMEIFDPTITFEMNLKDPDLIGYGVSEEFLKLNIEENFLPKIRKYCNKSKI